MLQRRCGECSMTLSRCWFFRSEDAHAERSFLVRSPTGCSNGWWLEISAPADRPPARLGCGKPSIYSGIWSMITAVNHRVVPRATERADLANRQPSTSRIRQCDVTQESSARSSISSPHSTYSNISRMTAARLANSSDLAQGRGRDHIRAAAHVPVGALDEMSSTSGALRASGWFEARRERVRCDRGGHPLSFTPSRDVSSLASSI